MADSVVVVAAILPPAPLEVYEEDDSTLEEDTTDVEV